MMVFGIRRATSAAGAWLIALTFASLASSQAPPVLEGRVPPDVPDGATIEAQIVSDGMAPVGAPIAAAEVAEGRFELALPERVGGALLEEERLGCEEDDLLDLAYLPHLLVSVDGETVGRLLLTDVPLALWRFGVPPKHAYWLYTPRAFAARGECRGGEVAVDLRPGWNPVLVVQEQSGMTFTGDSAPDGFSWHFAPAE